MNNNNSLEVTEQVENDNVSLKRFEIIAMILANPVINVRQCIFGCFVFLKQEAFNYLNNKVSLSDLYAMSNYNS